MNSFSKKLAEHKLSPAQEWSVMTALRGPDSETIEMTNCKYLFTEPLRAAVFGAFCNIAWREALLPPIESLPPFKEHHWMYHMQDALRALTGISTLTPVKVGVYLRNVREHFDRFYGNYTTSFCAPCIPDRPQQDYNAALQKLAMYRKLTSIIEEAEGASKPPTIRADFWLID